MDTRNEIRDFLISRRAKITPALAGVTAFVRNGRLGILGATAGPGSKPERALNLLASWTGTPDQEEAHADHEEQPRHRSGT